MATIDELQDRYDQYDVPPNPDGTFTVNGETMSAKDFRALKNVAKKLLDDAKKAAKSRAQKAKAKSKAETAQTAQGRIAREKVDTRAQKRQEEARKKIDLFQRRNQVDAALAAGDDIPEGLQVVAGGMSNETPEERLARIERRNAEIAKLQALLPETPERVQGEPTTFGAAETTTTTTVPSKPTSEFTDSELETARRYNAGKIQGPVSQRIVLAAQSLKGETAKGKQDAGAPTDTGAGGAGGTGGGGGGGRRGGQGAGANVPKLTDAQVDAAIRKNYPQYAYMLDNPDLFGADVLKIMRRASKEQWPADRFQGAILKTKYWQSTVSSARFFDAMSEADRQTLIEKTRQEIDGYTDTSVIDESTLLTFSRDMARRGISGDSLRPLAFKFAFDQGAQADAAQEALVSQTAQGIRQTARLYGQSLDDNQLQTLLTNGETPESVQRKYVAKLKAQYPQLGAQLDAGLNFADITDDYKRVAAGVLEKSADSIDFMDPKYMEAIAEPDGKGGYRQLSLGEWQKKLRTDDRYGYSKTTQAVQDARALASSIARSFGKVM